MYQRREYVWLDGYAPRQLRSKVKYELETDPFSKWSFDGSSTKQASTNDSDVELIPIFICEDPLHYNGRIVLCDTPNSKRKDLLSNPNNYVFDAAFGFEQEYVLLGKNGAPLGWTVYDKPAPQGPYYCGVGADKVSGRDIVEEHAKACISAGLMFYGTNAEVMLGQWEFQIGPRNELDLEQPCYRAADHLWVARFLLQKIAEKYEVSVCYDPKPIEGDWNGSGLHTNFSTKKMRDKDGIKHIRKFIEKLKKTHKDHIKVYGKNNHLRLTGKHETSSINKFSCGDSDRGASIRIPKNVLASGKGYLEDRRPAANADPYDIIFAIFKTYNSK